MRGDLTIRTVRTKSGATAVQVVQNKGKQRSFLKHIGSAHTEQELELLMAEARQYAETHCRQPNLFAETPAPPPPPLSFQDAFARSTLVGVTHQFARRVLLACARKCGLGNLPELYLDLALMRIIEPASKLMTLELLESHFNVQYSRRTLHRMLPKLLEHQAAIESAAIQTARDDMQEKYSLVLYDVTTLYFESFKEYNFQKPGFSKDNKPMQPQIVIGLITTRSGFPVMHEVFEGNTFEGHTMLAILKRFQERVGKTKPVIIADAAMLSKTNMQELEKEGYCYIVGARLANTAAGFIDQIDRKLPRTDKAVRRFDYGHAVENAAMICEFSDARYKKDKREFDKQVKRALVLLEKNEPGRRAKFVKKSKEKDKPFMFDTALQAKTEKLLGVKGFVSNIPEETMSSADVISYYRDLWHVEQAFRMSKSDLQARPIFHRTQDSIRGHMLICFMGLMMGKYLEINTRRSLRQLRKELLNVHEAHIRDEQTGEVHVMQMDTDEFAGSVLGKLLGSELSH
ncbi:MAG: IS1634 family transposase [Chlorobium sp.]|uniref:IS1634 family transposase n=1 Tax=Chlorobium sp. TaxID=1095 RepID=UPI002F5FE4C5